jgi:hypothetical protein
MQLAEGLGQCATSLSVVVPSTDMVCWGSFMVFSFHLRSLLVIFTLIECHL